jgi:hypothetical protein
MPVPKRVPNKQGVHAVMLEVDFAFQPEELRLNPNPSLR